MENKKETQKTLHICHVFPSESWGGAEIYVRDLAQESLQSGMRVTIWGSAGSQLLTEAEKIGAEILDVPIPKNLSWDFSKRVAELVKQNKWTHFQFHWMSAPKVFWLSKFFVKIPMILHNHMWMKHWRKDPWTWLSYSSLDQLVVAGPRAKRAAIQTLPLADRKITEIPYAISMGQLKEIETLVSVEKGNFWREKLKIPSDAILFGFFGRIDRQKGVLEFLNAIEPHLQQNKKLYGVIVGDATRGEVEAQKLDEEVTELLQKPSFQKILRLPFQKDLDGLLSEVDLLVAPSYNESYALIFLHAFIQGKPALSTLAGGTPDLVQAPAFGWLVPPQDVAKLSACMKDILRDPEEMKRRGANAKVMVQREHSYAPVLKRWKKLYEATTDGSV